MKHVFALALVASGNADVSCGSQRASSCSQCPPAENPKQVWKWCKGDCVWDEQSKACADKKTGEGHHYHQRVARENDEHGTPETPVRMVSCGKESAKNCGECPKGADPSKVWQWCSGECVWDE